MMTYLTLKVMHNLHTLMLVFNHLGFMVVYQAPRGKVGLYTRENWVLQGEELGITRRSSPDGQMDG
jgi:hypothetical protein